MNTPVPDYLFIDAILLAYRLGHIRYDEQREALHAAARAATDALTFMTAVDNFGIGRSSQLFHFLGQMMAAPAYYRAQYPRALGLRREGEEAEPFLRNPYVLFLTEGILNSSQYQLFSDAYWWFVNNHEPVVYDVKKGQSIGIYATDPRDNASTVARFEEYLHNLVNHKSQRVRQRFEGFPIETVLAILRRAFL
ncbi:MAG: hypothetical protein IJT75_04960 [Bacteroidaceae bacterium]|nr:hypothetical protein [Bacteroidaceae bacterium]